MSIWLILYLLCATGCFGALLVLTWGSMVGWRGVLTHFAQAAFLGTLWLPALILTGIFLVGCLALGWCLDRYSDLRDWAVR